MLQLHIKAPFATFRNFTAGTYRPTAPFMTPSAAYGLILNIAGIESRQDDGKSVVTGTRQDLPSSELAIGTPRLPQRERLLQQLHNYPVGDSGKTRKESCKGTKYNIQPIRREVLTNLDAWLCIRAEEPLLTDIRKGLSGGVGSNQQNGRPRYGLPFLGDNNFLIDVLQEEPLTQPVHWFYAVDLHQVVPEELPQLYRMPVWIDRMNLVKTESALYALASKAALIPPPSAWSRVGPPTKANNLIK